jgi:hypothetical protein
MLTTLLKTDSSYTMSSAPDSHGAERPITSETTMTGFMSDFAERVKTELSGVICARIEESFGKSSLTSAPDCIGAAISKRTEEALLETTDSLKKSLGETNESVQEALQETTESLIRSVGTALESLRETLLAMKKSMGKCLKTTDKSHS